MLLAIDIGNSNIVYGLFGNDKLTGHWRIETLKDKDEAYYRQFFEKITDHSLEGIVIGSVVPELDDVFTVLLKKIFGKEPMYVSTELSTGIPNLSKTRSKLGADRLANIVAANTLYQGNKIVVDLGTASKFEAVSEKGEYLGGAIGPGVGNSLKSLIQGASKLSDIALSQPEKVVGGFTTEEHLNSGFVHGFAGMVDGMVARMKEEQGWEHPKILLTGGFTDLISPNVKTGIIVNKALTLEGLRILWEKNK